MLGIVAPVRNCQTLLYILGSFAGFCLAFTSLLFLYRVRAVYSQSKIVRGFFDLLWVVMAGSCVLVPVSLEGEVSSYPSPQGELHTQYLSFIFCRMFTAYGTNKQMHPNWDTHFRLRNDHC